MSRLLKLDWKNFILDFIRNPCMTVSRLKSIVVHGTGERKKERILKALRDAGDEFRKRYADEIDYVMQHQAADLQVFPYPKLGGIDIKTGFDINLRLPYAIHDSKRLYFPKLMALTDVERAYRSFIEDEDIFGNGYRAKSPHSYTDAEHFVEPGDIVLDVGCAEGLFALDCIERVKKAYLFEVLDCWAAPIRATFAPFSEKTTFIRKLVADKTGGDKICLSDAVKGCEGDVYFLKMDVEGWEATILSASRAFLSSNKVKISCCTYHRQEDEQNIVQLLVSMGFKIRMSNGYMLPPLGEIKPPYFRRGVVYGRNF